MSSEPKPDRPESPDEAVPQDTGERSLSRRRMPYKSALAAVVIAVSMIGALWVIKDPSILESVLPPQADEPDAARHAAVDTEDPEVSHNQAELSRIEQRLQNLTGRIERAAKARTGWRVELKQRLAAMADTLQQIEQTTADLGESNRTLSAQVGEASRKLDVLAKHLRALRTVKRRRPSKPKPRPARVPPFQVDAIDIWDDTTYVAVSQAGHTTFLKLGDRRAGWSVTRIERVKGKVTFSGPVGQTHTFSLSR